MPGMTGLQLLERVAARRPQVIRLLITGWTESIPETAIRAVGVRAVISKPWEDAALKETLRRRARTSEHRLGERPRPRAARRSRAEPI